MATKEEIKMRNEYVKNVLRTSDGVSKKELIETLNIKERSLENIIKELKNAGWEIGIEKGLYFLRNKDEIDNKNEEPEAHKSDVYKVLILFCLMDKDGNMLSLSEKELYKAVTGERGSSEWFTTAISEMLSEGYIQLRSNKYSLGMNAPRLVVGIYDDYDDTMLLDLAMELSDKADSSDAIKRIKDRIEWQYSGHYEDDDNKNIFVRQGRHKNMDAIMGLIKDKLLTVPYMEKALELHYKTRSGEFVDSQIKVGLLLYSASLDCTYVLGESVEDGDKILCLRISGIESINVLDDIDNDVYNSDKYNNIYTKMFGIGYEKEERVEIAFADKPYVKGVVEKLYDQRKKQGGEPSLKQMEDGRWLYSDTIIGANNILPYVRRMRTENCEIISPESLREKMKASAERILRRYGCEEV